MTTIAYKDGTMAADSQLTRGDTIPMFGTCKIIENDGWLIGVAGDLADIVRIENALAWHLSETTAEGTGKTEKRALTAIGKDCNDAQLLVVTPTYQVYEFDMSRIGVLINLPFYAIGSGADFALGAMEAGATARRAVEVSTKFDIRSGGQINTAEH